MRKPACGAFSLWRNLVNEIAQLLDEAVGIERLAFDPGLASGSRIFELVHESAKRGFEREIDFFNWRFAKIAGHEAHTSPGLEALVRF